MKIIFCLEEANFSHTGKADWQKSSKPVPSREKIIDRLAGRGGKRGGERKKEKNSKPGERAIEFSGRETLCGIPNDLDF